MADEMNLQVAFCLFLAVGPKMKPHTPAVLLVIFFVRVGDGALPNGLDVTFEVTELRRLTGSYNTMVGNNEGSMV